MVIVKWLDIRGREIYIVLYSNVDPHV